MIYYGIGILLLICELRTAHTHVTQPWYTNNAGAGVTFDALQEHMRDMLVRGPPLGYLPYLTNSLFVVSLWNVQRAEAHLRGMGVLVVTGS